MPDTPLYELRHEQLIVAALVRSAAARYAARFGGRPANAVEVGFWVEGARLVVRFVADPAYQFNRIVYPSGFTETPARASYGEFTTVPSWDLLSNLSVSTGVRVLDDAGAEVRLHATDEDGVQDGWRDVVKAAGRNVMRAVVDGHPEAFGGVTLTDPCEVTVYEDEDSSLAWYLRVVGGVIED